MAAKDNLKDLLQERFTQHEVGVDPGVWQAISGQLASVAPAADGLSDLLKERFKEHELDVDPGTWGHISSQLGQGAAASGSGFGGWIAAGLAAAVITGAAIFWAVQPDAPTPSPVAVTTTTTSANNAPSVDPNTVQASTPGQEQVSVRSASTPPAATTQPSAVQNPAATDADAGVVPQTFTSGQPPHDQPPTDPSPSGPVVVNQIIQQMAQQTLAEPVIAQTETVPGAGLVQGQYELQPDVDPEPEPDDQGQLSAAPPTVWIPNAFSPGMRDGVNDDLEVRAEGLQNVQVRIYSLSSQLVFRSNDLRAWDGRDMNGQLCQQGYYFYAIEGLDGNDRPFSKGQTVYLFR